MYFISFQMLTLLKPPFYVLLFYLPVLQSWLYYSALTILTAREEKFAQRFFLFSAAHCADASLHFTATPTFI